jgi:putative MATE family efflux protein
MKKNRFQKDKDWTQGSITRNLVLLSLPIITSQSLNMIGPTIDLIWVGKLGSVSIAGVGVAGMAVMFVMSAMMGLAQGARAMVARFVGSGNASEANNVAQHAFVISTVYSFIMVMVGIFFSEAILRLLGVDAEVVAEGGTYLRIMFVGATARSFRMMTESIMQSSGDAITPMKISFLFRSFHIVLCPFLILGWWIFPRLGVSGAALTNILSQSLGLVVGLWVLYNGHTRLALSLKDFHLDLHIVWRMVKIGIPVAVMGMQRSLGQLLLIIVMAPFGTMAVAAHSLIHRIEMVLAMLCMGMGISAGVLAGQSLGAGKPDRAEKSGWYAAGLAETVMVICSTAVFIWPEVIIRVFNTEPNLVNTASIFLRIAVVGFLMLGCGPLFVQMLSGIGDTLPPMLIALLNTWGLLIPLAFILPKIGNLGVFGVRWAMAAAMFLPGAAYLIYFKTGRWKRKVV